MKTTLSCQTDQMPFLRIHLLYQITQRTADLLSFSLFCLIIARISDLYPFLLFLFTPLLWPDKMMLGSMHTYSSQCIVFNALLPTLYISLFICTGAQVFPMLDWHTPIYGSPFNLIAFDLWTFPIDSYVQIVSKYGLSSCSFSDILILVDFMQMNVHPRSF